MPRYSCLHTHYNKVKDKWTVEQKISYLSIYHLEGSFEQAILKLQKEAEYYAIGVVLQVYGDYICRKDALNRAWVHEDRDLIFNEIYLDLGVDEDGDKQLQIWGRRDATAEEVEILEEYEAESERKHLALEREQFEALKKKFEGGQ